MEGSAWRALLAAVILIQLRIGNPYDMVSKGQLTFRPPTIYYDWPLSENQTNIVHIGNSGSERVFAFAAHDPSNKTAVINIVTTKSSEDQTRFRDERCEFDFDVPDNSTVVIDSIRLWYRDEVYSVRFSWHIEGEKRERADSVDSITCHHAEWHRELKKKKNRGAEEAKAPAANETEAEIAERLAKLVIPEGYSFVDELASNESTVQIKHVNLASGSVALAAEVKLPEASSLTRYSLARDRYGVCWTGDKSVTCAEGPLQAKEDQYELKTWGTVRLALQPDLLGVLNYAEDKILVVVGSCTESTQRCDYVELYEVRPDGGVFWHSASGLQMSICRNRHDIRIGGYYDAKRNQTCFDVVCASQTVMMYRRVCADFGSGSGA